MLVPRVHYDLFAAPSVRLDDIVLGVGELQLKVVMNRVEDVRYPDRARLSHGDWSPVPPHPRLVDEAEVDA